jgi:hypothetical protein
MEPFRIRTTGVAKEVDSGWQPENPLRLL